MWSEGLCEVECYVEWSEVWCEVLCGVKLCGV